MFQIVLRIWGQGHKFLSPTKQKGVTRVRGLKSLSRIFFFQGFANLSQLGESMSFLEESRGEVDAVKFVEYLHGKSPDDFTCRLVSSKPKLKILMDEINAHDRQHEVCLQ